MAKTKDKWFFKNLIMAVIVIAVLMITTQLLLNKCTRHNQEISVPDFSEMPLSEAEHLAAASDVRIDVTDSVSIKRLARGAVFSQNPAPGSKVKKGRRILITINATKVKTVSMPNLVGYSLRQAKTELLASGLKIGKLTYKEDLATNNVLDQRIGNRTVVPGTEVELESEINLVLGCDPSNPDTFIPFLIGYTREAAEDFIIEGSLNVGRVQFDETVTSYEDSLKAVVYMQSPVSYSNASYPMGTAVDISLTVSQSKVLSMKKEMERAAMEAEE